MPSSLPPRQHTITYDLKSRRRGFQGHCRRAPFPDFREAQKFLMPMNQVPNDIVWPFRSVSEDRQLSIITD